MQKAAEDLRNEAKAKAEEKERFINERVTPLKLDGLGQGNCTSMVKNPCGYKRKQATGEGESLQRILCVSESVTQQDS